MQQQTIPSSDAPETTNGSARGGSSDPFVDSAMDALTDLGNKPANDNAEPSRARRRPLDEQRPEPEGPGTEEGDEGEEQPVPGGEPPEEDEGEAAQEADGEDEEAHDTRGSEENPLTVKDFNNPNIHVKVKVDGVEKVVKLPDIVASYIGQQTINQRLNQTKKLTDEAHALAARAKEERTTVKRAVTEFLKDPEQIFEFFNDTAEREKILEAVAVKYAEQVTRFRKNPEERLRFERARDEARLAWEREQWEQQVQAEARAKQQAEMQQRAESIFRPGWEAGIKRAGFPQPTKELYEEVLVRCNQRAASGAEVTTDDVAEFTYRACKLLELKPKGAQKPRPAPAPTPREAAPRRNGKDPWKDKPARERVKDPDYFLKSLRSRDYRL